MKAVAKLEGEQDKRPLIVKDKEKFRQDMSPPSEPPADHPWGS